MANEGRNSEEPRSAESSAESLKSPEIKRPVETSKEKKARLIAKAKTYVRDLSKRGADLSEKVAATAGELPDDQLLRELVEVNDHAEEDYLVLEGYEEGDPNEGSVKEIDLEVQRIQEEEERADAEIARDADRFISQSEGAHDRAEFMISMPPERKTAVASKLIEDGNCWKLLQAGPFMSGVDWNVAFEKLTRSNDIKNALDFLGSGRPLASGAKEAFTNVLGTRLLETDPSLLLDNLNAFPNADMNALGARLLESNSLVLVQNLDRFPGADKRALAEKLIVSLQGSTEFIKHVDQFPEEVRREFSSGLVESNPVFLTESLEKFPEIDKQKLFMKLVKVPTFSWMLLQKIDQFPGVDMAELGQTLLESSPRDVIEHLDRFPGVDMRTLATALLSKADYALINNIERFPQNIQEEVIPKLIKQSPYEVFRSVGRFPTIDMGELGKSLLENHSLVLVDHLEKFPNTDMATLADKLMNRSLDTLIEHVGKFSKEDLAGIGTKFLEKKEIAKLLAIVEYLPNDNPPLSHVLKIKRSPFQGTQRIAEQLVPMILADANPGEKLQKIEDMFAKNHLPDLGKRFKILEILNPADVIDKKLSGNASPTLRSQTDAKRRATIYRDFMRSMIDSGNRDLRKYIEAFALYEPVSEKVESEGEEALSDAERGQFNSFLKRMDALLQSASLGKDGVGEKAGTNTYQRLKSELGIKPGESVSKGLAERYLRPLGLKTMREALDRMNYASGEADTRNRDLAANAPNGYLRLSAGDLCKGTEARWVASILDTGSNSKEFLGASSDSDLTPFDTDLSIVLPGQEEAAMQHRSRAEGGMEADAYGEILFVIKDRGQFVRTDLGQKDDVFSRATKHAERPYELFVTGVHGEGHVGVRTGIASTEISYMMVKTTDAKVIKNLKVDIAEKGSYVPLTDKDGKIIFTPKEYDSLRKATLSGLEAFGGPAFEIRDSSDRTDAEHERAVDEIKEQKAAARETMARQTGEIRAVVDRVFEASGVKWNKDLEDSVLGALIHDMGSSGRETDVPGSADFDFIVKLDRNDLSKNQEIHDALIAEFRKLGGKPIDGADRASQLRVKDVSLPGSDGQTDIDIAFVSKSEMDTYESHDAVRDRLNWIRENEGQDAHDTVVANIVLTKKILKKAEAYKRAEQGGLGGIGVENFVLANGGDMIAAFESFRDASKNNDGSLKPFKDFQASYSILDAGINAKGGGHDDFANKIQEEAYKKMADAIDAYLTAHVTPKTA